MVAQRSLLNKYFNLGWLSRRYYNGSTYLQPYSAEDRLDAGAKFYEDFVSWNALGLKARDYSKPVVDTTRVGSLGVCLSPEAERFRQALRSISRVNLPVIYKIVLEEIEIKAPKSMTAREVLYFNDEIKGLLCRGLDELVSYYLKTV